MRRVWVDHWQMQCCGEPFAVSDSVRWTVTHTVDQEWLAEVVGMDLAQTVTDAEEHHETPDMSLADLEGVVQSILAVYCEYVPSADKRMQVPVPGSARLRSRDAADGWEPREEDATFVGYLVDLVNS